MLERKITRRLEAWYASPRRKALLVTGARQVGKTYSIREFAKSHYGNFVEVNFLDGGDDAALLAGARDAEDFIERLTLLSARPLSQGRTLLFLDEIQDGPDVVTLAKFLVEADRFDLVLSGSLLGVELKNVRSFPVGYLHEERMYPLDFEEFCWSQGVPKPFIERIRRCYDEKAPVAPEIHDRFVALFRRYLVVGGMPEAVSAYTEQQRDIAAARGVHTDILNQYRRDMTRYAPGRSLFICAIYDALPSELAKVNKRFMLKTVKTGATYESLQDDFDWLDAAGVALRCCFIAEPSYPLERTRERRKFKLYSSDVGLLMASYPAGVSMAVLGGARSVNFGAVYENAVAQELTAAGMPLCYYNNNRKGELDFLLETVDGSILPIEVKSGKDYKLHTALNNVLGTEEYGIERAYVLSEANVSVGERQGKPVYYLPIYMAMFLGGELGGFAGGTHLPEIDFSDLASETLEGEE